MTTVPRMMSCIKRLLNRPINRTRGVSIDTEIQNSTACMAPRTNARLRLGPHRSGLDQIRHDAAEVKLPAAAAALIDSGVQVCPLSAANREPRRTSADWFTGQ